MNAKETIHLLERLNQLIRLRATGTPKELCSKLTISERSLYYYLGVMKELGAPIEYSNSARSYYYSKLGTFGFRFHLTCKFKTMQIRQQQIYKLSKSKQS